MTPEPLEQTVPVDKDDVEDSHLSLPDGITVEPHHPTNGLKIRRYDPPAFSSTSAIVIPHNETKAELAAALISDLPLEIVEKDYAEALEVMKEQLCADSDGCEYLE